MRYAVVQTRRFARALQEAAGPCRRRRRRGCRRRAGRPRRGGAQKGDLAALRVHEFRVLGQIYLLGYAIDEQVRLIYLEAVGPHENFYRDLNR